MRARAVAPAGLKATLTVARSSGAAASARHCLRKLGECSSAQRTIGCNPSLSWIESGKVNAGASHAATRAARADDSALRVSVTSAGARKINEVRATR